MYRFINVDFTMLTLNTTSVGVLALNWFSEYMTGIGGFLVMLSIAILNISKAYVNYRKGKNENN